MVVAILELRSGHPEALVVQTYQKSICKKDWETHEERTHPKGAESWEDPSVPITALIIGEEGSLSRLISKWKNCSTINTYFSVLDTL